MIRFLSYKKNVKRHYFTYIESSELKQIKKDHYPYAILFGGVYIVYSPELKKTLYVLGIEYEATLFRLDIELSKSGRFPRRIWFLSREDFLIFKEENADKLRYFEYKNKQKEEILSEIEDKYGKIVYSREKLRVGKYIQE